MSFQPNPCDPGSRRQFVANAAKCWLGLGTLPLVPASAKGDSKSGIQPGGTAKRVIYLYMSGGMTHLDTFDTKPGSETQGPCESINTSVPGVQISEYFPKLAKQMHHVAAINSLSSTQGAHQQGRYFMHTSYFVRGTIKHPDLGGWTSYFLGKEKGNLPGNVKIGGSSSGLGGGFLESKYSALPIGDPEAGLQNSKLPRGIDGDRFARRINRAKEMNQKFLDRYNDKQVRAYSGMYDEAVKVMKSEDLGAFDLSLEKTDVRNQYGMGRFGQACLLARRLVESGVRFVEVDNGGWDTHTDNFGRVETKGRELDQALATLISDLEQRDLLKDTLIVLATEFGRTPKIVTERQNGRNHYPKAFSGLLIGGGIQGGIKYGKTDKEGREVEENPVEVPDFNATIGYALGLPLEKDVFSPSRRPFRVAHKGKPITALFS
ncbi:MAG: DUF1501 domain-containing protein [Planctomycetota bacterium]|nr:DUF1501 domain-containing protein [Planctomycetota bacterium]